MRLSKLVPIIGAASALTAGALASPRLVTDLRWRLRSRFRPAEGSPATSGLRPGAVTSLDDRRGTPGPEHAGSHRAVGGRAG